MTIIEMSVALALLIGLAGVTAFSFGGYRDWKLGKEASATLQVVYIAQKSLLADRPTLTLAELSESDLLPYIPGRPPALPTIESLDGTQLTVDFRVLPPVVAGQYDPSCHANDGIWDVGRH